MYLAEHMRRRDVLSSDDRSVNGRSEPGPRSVREVALRHLDARGLPAAVAVHRPSAIRRGRFMETPPTFGRIEAKPGCGRPGVPIPRRAGALERREPAPRKHRSDRSLASSGSQTHAVTFGSLKTIRTIAAGQPGVLEGGRTPLARRGTRAGGASALRVRGRAEVD